MSPFDLDRALELARLRLRYRLVDHESERREDLPLRAPRGLLRDLREERPGEPLEDDSLREAELVPF